MKCITQIKMAADTQRGRPASMSHIAAHNRAGRGRRMWAGILTAVVCWSSAATTLEGVGPDPPPPPNVPPFIDDFSGTEGMYEWTFEGRVLDEHPVGLIITFGGLLSGHQTTVEDADGHFYYSATVEGPGTVTAHTVDDLQQGSNDADCDVL